MAENVNSDASVAASDFNFEDVLWLVLKWKWVVLFFSLTIPILTLLAMLLVKPVYTSSTIISIKSFTPESMSLGGKLTSAAYEQLNVLEETLFIKSSMVLSDVVRELNLNVEFTKQQRFIDLVLSILKSRPLQSEYRDAVSRINLSGSAQEGVWIDFYTPNKFFVTSVADGKQMGTGTVDELFEKGEAVFLISNFPHKVQDRFLLKQRSVEAVARQLARDINVDSLGSKQSIGMALTLEISSNHSDPQTAVDLVNTVASVYLKRKYEEASETISQVLRFIDQQMKNLLERTEKSTQDVELYKEEQGLYFIDESAKSRLNNMLALDLESSSMELQVSILENLRSMITEGNNISSKQVMLISSIQAPVATQIANKLNNLQLERTAMARRFTPMHPEMLANESKIEEARKMLIEALDSQIEIFREKIRTNKLAVEKFSEELSQLNRGMRNLNRLTRISLINERILTFMMRRNEETKIQKASIVSNVRVMKPGYGATLVKPKRERYIMSGILAGLLIGIGISFFLETMDNSIKSPSWIEEKLGLPIYGMIPHFQGSGKKVEVPMYRERKIQLIMQQDPKSRIAESYRSLRTNIQFANLDKRPQLLQFTSPAPREGKSTTVANLAITMANMGASVLIMDCDLRKPIMHRFFNFNKENGVTDILTRNVPWKDVLKETEIENCFLITSGKSPPNPSELLGGGKMKQLLADLREAFDVILIDSSPVIPVTDALVLAPDVDALFVLFEINRTTTDAAIATVSALNTVNVRPTGVIINNILPEQRGYGYGYGYGYGKYGYGYGYRYRYGYKNYRYYDYYSYYTRDDDDDEEQEEIPKTGFEKLMDKILGRKDETNQDNENS